MTPAWNANYHVKASIDETKQYRYLFECNWSPGGRFVTFIMLNPSVGSVEQTDPTLVRCMQYAKLWGYDGLKVVNLFAYIATDPEKLNEVLDPIGPENDDFIRYAAEHSDIVVLAWGECLSTPAAKQRMDETLAIVQHKQPCCLKVTAEGNYPRHPLYLSKDLQPIPYMF